MVGERHIVARLGGDEFTILQTNIDNMVDWTSSIERIKNVISEPISIDGNTHYVHASVGVAFYPTDGSSVETLMRNADVAMYHAKKTKNQL
ncbi:hypothetical protein GCM10025859_55850 [Alicyclobacillus fastidiosus]|nr:hypothetical protein GCM10025859_55850 [Alicyclobacillus fastidiosus]